MARKRNPLATWATTWLSLGFIALTARLPLPVCRALGIGIGRLAYAAVPRVRRVGRANLDLAYGDTLTDREKRRILREAAENMGIVAAEFSRISVMTPENARNWIRIEGTEHVPKDRGGFMVSAHMANWEWMAPAVVLSGLSIAEVVRPFDDPRFNAAIDRIRQSWGVETIPKDNAGLVIRKRIREGYLVGVLIDQSPRHNAVPVTFFGQRCWATAAPAMIALRTQTPIQPVSMRRDPDGGYTLRFFPFIEPERSGDLRRDLVAISQQCQDVVEGFIRENPGQWLWMHRRWKERPRLEREWAAKSADDDGDEEP